ncbi:MAG: aminoglycoside phosphotransferase family protein, partial [Oscillospiraceae bacterium]
MLTTEQLQKYASNKFFSEALHIYDPSKLDFNLLGQGEYNINYVFTHPDNGKKLVLRLNTGSQMHLPNQIEYEYHALKLLENSKRTPKAFFVDGSRKYIDFGVLVMEFLSGVPLDYKTDLSLAASCLADIHKTNISDSTSLIKPKNPLKAILQECDAMAKKYLNSELADAFVGDKLKRMISAAARLPLDKEDDGNCIINTELNSGNFLINGAGGRNYLIDWEKPIIGEAAQDIA